MKKRPWLWIVLAYAIFMALTISFVAIAVKNKQADVPLKPLPTTPSESSTAVPAVGPAGETLAGPTSGTHVLQRFSPAPLRT